MLQQNLDQMIATVPAEAFLVTPGLSCGIFASAYFSFTFLGQLGEAKVNRYKGEMWY